MWVNAKQGRSINPCKNSLNLLKKKADANLNIFDQYDHKLKLKIWSNSTIFEIFTLMVKKLLYNHSKSIFCYKIHAIKKGAI